MIIGVFIKQATTYATISHIIIEPISAIADMISEDLKRNNIFNHKEIPKIDYAYEFEDTFQVENYIERRCKHYGGTDYYSLLTKRLFDYADDNQFKGNIVLTGEGGLGKTYELINLAVQLFEYEDVHPFYYPLGDYYSGITSLKDISEKVNEYRKNHVTCCLLLDGFDEIINPVDIDRFRRMINNENYNNNACSVIISSRKTGFQSGMFRGFMELELCPLRRSEVQRIVRNRGINADDFFAEVERNHLERVAEFPFYLNELTTIFTEEGHLPERAKLFEKMIDSILAKCYRTYRHLGEGLGVSGNCSAKNNLTRIAMAMNYMGKTMIDDGEFNDIVGIVCNPMQPQVMDTLNSDINQALDNIAQRHLDMVLEKMRALSNSENLSVKRAANNYILKWEKRKEYSERPVLNVYEAAKKVATETTFNPFC